jgi:hypothetical protein
MRWFFGAPFLGILAVSLAVYEWDVADNEVRNGFWQRHLGSTVAAGLFAILVIAETLRSTPGRRPPTRVLLPDNLTGETPPDSQRVPSLHIDTTSSLWDRELDG